MKYFIDFEATQFTNLIIEIGVIREDSRCFHSLVNPEVKLTNFIKNLTGITQEELAAAPSYEEVLEQLFDFFLEDTDEEIIIYAYGNGDTKICEDTLRKKATSMKSKMVLSFLAKNIVDYSQIAAKKLKSFNTIGLSKLAYALTGYLYPQMHDAFIDTYVLKMIYEKIEESEGLTAKSLGLTNYCPRPEGEKVTGIKLLKDGEITETFESLSEVLEFFIKANLITENESKTILQRKRIKQRIKTRKHYCGYDIEIEKEKKDE